MSPAANDCKPGQGSHIEYGIKGLIADHQISNEVEKRVTRVASYLPRFERGF